MQLQLFELARDAVFRTARCAVRRAHKARVAAPAVAPLREQHFLARCDEITNQNRIAGRIRRLLIHQRADRHLELEIGGVGARAVRSFAVRAAFRVKFAIEAIGNERVQMRAGDGVYRPAVAAVAAIRAAARHELLAAEAHAPAPARAGFYEDVDFVDEHGMDAES